MVFKASFSSRFQAEKWILSKNWTNSVSIMHWLKTKWSEQKSQRASFSAFPRKWNLEHFITPTTDIENACSLTEIEIFYWKWRMVMVNNMWESGQCVNVCLCVCVTWNERGDRRGREGRKRGFFSRLETNQ